MRGFLSRSRTLSSGVSPDYFRERLRLVHAIVLLLGAVFFVFVTAARALKEPAPFDEWFFGPATAINLLQIAFNLSVYIWLGRVSPPARALDLIDVFGTLAIAGLCSAYAWTERFIPGQEHHAILAVSNLLFLRAVIVPGLPGRAIKLAIVGALISTSPLAWVSGIGWHDATPDRLLRVAFFVSWALISLILSVVACRVIHGLRREVKEAEQLGQYTLGERIGAGGMGTVYRASHALMRRPCAIKILQPDRVDPADVERFEREVQATSQLSHPNTIAIFDYGKTDDGVFYYAMELLGGMDLSRLVRDYGPQYPGRVVHIVLQILGSLEEAHAHGLVHRDIKPANIHLCHRGNRDDVVKVLDFGLVKDCDDAEGSEEGLMGTPRYLAPESILNPQATDARSDLYAVAAVAYHLLTGTHVFQGRTVGEVLRQHREESPESPSKRLGRTIPEDLETIILEALAKDPADRPQSAEEFATILAATRAAAMWGPEAARTWWDQHAHSQRVAIGDATLLGAERARALRGLDDKETISLRSQDRTQISDSDAEAAPSDTGQDLTSASTSKRKPESPSDSSGGSEDVTETG
jgi:eukaryotic-like serine/threonine-protein kinase